MFEIFWSIIEKYKHISLWNNRIISNLDAIKIQEISDVNHLKGLFEFSQSVSDLTLISAFPSFKQDFKIVAILNGYDKFALKKRKFVAIAYSLSLNMTLIGFSATMFSSEWFDDCDYRQVEFKHGTLVHDGFHGIYSTFRNEMMNKIQEVSGPDTSIVFVGHSLGGALATLAFADLESSRASLFTFGSPRVGNPRFAKFVNQLGRIQRVFNTEDIISTLPLPINSGYTYEHIQRGIGFTLNLSNYTDNHIQAYYDFVNRPTFK